MRMHRGEAVIAAHVAGEGLATDVWLKKDGGYRQVTFESLFDGDEVRVWGGGTLNSPPNWSTWRVVIRE